jgi:hypothetical protein
MANLFKHARNRPSWQPQRQAAWLVLLGVLITLTFGGISLSQIANYASTNREIEALIEERNRLELENEQYRAEIASLQTVPRLLERAEALGYQPATAADIEHITVDGYNPNRDETVVELQEDEEVAAPQYDATFAGWLQQEWDKLVNQFRSFGG